MDAAHEAGAGEVGAAAGHSAAADGGARAIEALGDAPGVPLTVACGVGTAWEDGARGFAPEKGADPSTVRRLERRLEALAAELPRDPRGVPHGGAAGGLAGGLWAAFGARLAAGATLVLDAVGFDARMRASRFVVTGEGRLDEQTLAGKLVGEVATRCRQSGVGCHAVVGENALDAFRARVLDLASVTEAREERDLEAAGRALAAV